jgi:hypothetical protein
MNEEQEIKRQWKQLKINGREVGRKRWFGLVYIFKDGTSVIKNNIGHFEYFDVNGRPTIIPSSSLRNIKLKKPT